MKQKEYFGFESMVNLNKVLKEEKAKNVFLVTGKKAYDSCGARQAIERELGKSLYTQFFNFSPNPKIEEIREGLKLFEKQRFDLIVAIGGGSVIDVAKAIKMFYFDNMGRKVPLVAIPTTAGTGSEATHFIVYYEGKEKQSVGKPELTLPEYSICDPTLTLSLPREIAASTAMDALSQAVESYWSVNSTEESKGYARESIKLIMDNLIVSVSGDRGAKEEIMRAANLAGKAINISKTTACHSISYPITSYFGVPHGHAAALTLGKMLVYNSKVGVGDCLDKRGPKYVEQTIKELVEFLGESTPEKAEQKITKLMEEIELATRLSQLKMGLPEIKLILEKGFNPERVKNNPRLLTEEGLEEILFALV